MLFPTVGFAIFFPLVFVGAWLLRPWPLRWKAFLLLASLVFFGWFDWRAAAVLVGLVGISQLAAAGVTRARTAAGARASVALVVLAGVATFVAVARSGFDGSALGVVVPLGLGLLVLRCISYVVDVRRGVLAPAPVVDAALGLSFFPAVVAGPLVRPSQLLPQLAAPPDARHLNAARAFRLLLVGLLQVWVLAAYLRAELIEPVLAAPATHSGQEALVAVAAITVELYCVLAGYASMAVGAGLLLGLRLPDNFDRPFLATSLLGAWRRWTVTFTQWFRDYVYLPLGAGRRGEGMAARNLLVTTAVAGLWLAAGWVGLAWGLFMGMALAVERVVTHGRPARGAGAVVGWVVTWIVLSLGWLLLQAGSLGAAADVLGRLGSWGASPLVTPLLLAVLAGVVIVQLLPRDVPRSFDVAFSRLPLVLQGLALGFGLVLIDALGQGVVAATVPARF